MKTLKFVSYVALIVLLFQIGLTASIPFRFPEHTVAWDIVVSSNSLLAILCGLLLILPKLQKSNRLKVMIGAALVSLIFVLIGWSPWIFSAVFLTALFGMYLAFSRI